MNGVGIWKLAREKREREMMKRERGKLRKRERDMRVGNERVTER
jgi:hypothetical protein